MFPVRFCFLRRIDSRVPSVALLCFGLIGADTIVVGAIVVGLDWFLLRNCRPDKPIDVIHRLDLRDDNAHLATQPLRRHLHYGRLLPRLSVGVHQQNSGLRRRSSVIGTGGNKRQGHRAIGRNCEFA